MATSIKSKLLATAAATALIGLAGCASQGSGAGANPQASPAAMPASMDKAYYNDAHKRGGMMKCSHKYSHKAKKAKKAKAAATTNSNNSSSNSNS